MRRYDIFDRMRRPLVAPCAALAGGVAAANAVSFGFTETLLAALALAALALTALRFRERRAGRAACLLALAFVGAQRAQQPAAANEQRVDRALLRSGVPLETPVRLRGWVREPPKRFAGADRIVVEAESLYQDSPAWGGVSLTVNRYPQDPPLQIAYGERIETLARFRELRNFGNPGAFDRVGYLHRQGIHINAAVRPRTPIRRLGNRRAGSLQAYVQRGRRELRERFDALWGGSRSAPVLRALLLGDSSLLERETTTAFQRTGAYHALVISGLHIGLLAFVLLGTLRLAAAPPFLRAAAAIAVVAGYVALAEAKLPATRAAMMFAAFLAASLIFRRRQALNVIAAAACGFLLVKPELLTDAGFQMSFLAVALIAAIGVPLLERTIEPYRRALQDIDNPDRDLHLDVSAAEKRVALRNWLEPLKQLAPWPQRLTTAVFSGVLSLLCWAGALALISAVMQLGMALPTAVYFQRVSFSGAFANLFLTPVLAFTIPCGLAALAGNWELPAAAASLGADWMHDWTVALAASLPLSLRAPPPPTWLAALLPAALAAWAWSLRRAGSRGWPGAIPVVVLVGVLCIHPFPPQIDAGRLELTALDVGQGESLFVVFPDGRTLLMDGGGRPDFRSPEEKRAEAGDPRVLDIGETVVSPYLWSRSIRRLDVVAVSHPDADHAAGIPAVLRNFEVGELWLGDGVFETDYLPLVELARAEGAEIVRVKQGDARVFGGARVEVLRPGRRMDPGAGRNDLSTVLRLRLAEHDFLLTGDIESRAEQSLLQELAGDRIEVLKVAHHGSRNSTSAAFLAKTGPLFAVISAGYDNTYGHPHRELLERLREANALPLSTDRDGAVSILSDGRRLEVRR